MSWILSLYYFLTFGGFVAMVLYLPIFLTEKFQLTASDAGLRTAGFVVLATAMRPLGGSLADRIGGNRILRYVFPVTALMAIFMACPLMSTFTIGAWHGCCHRPGQGSSVQRFSTRFPTTVGSVTGLVGAAGGLGGFFPPLLLGSIQRATGEFTWGFILLAVFSSACWLICWISNADEANSPRVAKN